MVVVAKDRKNILCRYYRKKYILFFGVLEKLFKPRLNQNMVMLRLIRLETFLQGNPNSVGSIND